MRIACGLVTFNRVGLLRCAIEAALSQSRPPDHIVVVNNASTDDTRDYLNSLNNSRFSSVHTSRNLGSAGGFRLAVDLAVANDYDAVWLFDDDGLPDPNALRALDIALQKHKLAMANSLVLSEIDPASLAFGLINETPGYRGPSIFTLAEAISQARDGLLFDMANPFNGTLLSSSVVRAVGPIRSEMFIWGDEVEYVRRIISKGHRLATVIEARHHHPKSKTMIVKTPLGAMRVPNKERRIYFYRNRAFNSRRHFGLRFCLKEIMMTTLRNLSRGAIREAIITIVWGLDGLTDLYMVKPTRRALNAAWSKEFHIAVAQSEMQQRPNL
jgi:rhamnopyranosyl-N-acetylglucosaminyl-diphospho-decaprenol beta-1,3/1,4-galactofuranosyltransferase